MRTGAGGPTGPDVVGSSDRIAPRVTALLVLAIVLAALVAACGTAAPSDGDGAAAAVASTQAPSPAPAEDVPATSERGADPPRLAVVGDSTAERLAPAVEAWGSSSGDVVYVGNAARLGCPLGRGGMLHTAADVIGPVNDECDWEAVATTGLDGVVRPTFAEVATSWDADLVVVSNGVWDVADRQLPGDDSWAHAGDEGYDEWLLGELLAANDELSAGGAQVIWLTLSPWEGATRHPPERLYAPAADPARVVAYNDLLDQVAAARPDTAVVVDLAGWLASTGEDARLRPDGAHFEPETAVEVVNRFLGAALLTVWRSIAPSA